MRGLLVLGTLFLCVVGAAAAPLSRAAAPEQFFASVLLEKKKIGQFQLGVGRADAGETEELKVRASVSMLGIKLYEFTHDLVQTWSDGALRQLDGQADENGTVDRMELTREASEYSGVLNGKPVTLPIEAFSSAIWHDGIVDHALLSNEVDLKLLNVTTTNRPDTIEFDKNEVAAQRLPRRRDFDPTVWFDQDEDFVMAGLRLAGRKLPTRRDPSN